MEFFATGEAETFVTSLGSSAADTIANLSPLTTTIGGVIVGFIVVAFIISLVKKTGKR